MNGSRNGGDQTMQIHTRKTNQGGVPPWRRPGVLAGGAAVILILGAVVTYLLLPGTSTSTPLAPGAAAPAGPGAQTSQPGAIAPPSAIEVPIPPQSPPASAIMTFSSWRTGGGLDRLNTVTADITTLLSTSPQTAGPCQTLDSDVAAAQSYAPMPDPQAQGYWNTGLRDAAQAAATCATHPETNVTTQLQSAATAINAATERMSYFSAH